MRVLLVAVPFGALDSPSLALGLLKAGLGRMDVDCDVAYLNLAFAARLGIERYRRIAEGLPQKTLAPDWIFAEALYETDLPPADDYAWQVLRLEARIDEADIELILDARPEVAPFLWGVLEEFPWSDYDVVGFTCGGQTIPSLALAKLVKQRHPHIFTVFGGPSWHGVMGKRLFSLFPFVDAACLGDGDIAFPSLVRAIADDDAEAAGRIEGMLVRGSRNPDGDETGHVVEDLDGLPIPDFSDFSTARADYVPGLEGGVAIPTETSRGCWWAARGPCKFCGVVEGRRTYRTKSAGRILEELRILAAQPDCRTVEILDSVASPLFLSNVLAQLERDPLPVGIDMDIRPDVSRRVVDLLGASRASVLIGIESLSDHLLAMMDKGTQVLENVRVLKWCRTAGVPVRWNLLYALPGETADDYLDAIHVLGSIPHLDPPIACGPVVIERFSQHFEDPESYGFTDIHPTTAYSYVYPFDEDCLKDVAYFFDHDFLPGCEPAEGRYRLRRLVCHSREVAPTSELRMQADEVIVDSRRPGDPMTYHLDELERTLYAACDDICRRVDLEEVARKAGVDGERLPERIDEALAWFVERDLMLQDDDRYLSLALPESSPLPQYQATAASEPGRAQPQGA